MKKNILNYTLLGLVFAPMLSLAAEDIYGLIDDAGIILGALLPLIMTLSVFYFLWALAKYMLKAGTEQEEAKQQMLWGIIILFVMISVWGLVSILQETVFF